jgi:hypothetical protein
MHTQIHQTGSQKKIVGNDAVGNAGMYSKLY